MSDKKEGRSGEEAAPTTNRIDIEAEGSTSAQQLADVLKATVDPVSHRRKQAFKQLRFNLGEDGLKLFFDRRDALQQRRFSAASEIPAPIPRFLVAGRTISTSGNLTTLTAQAKAGKSAVIGAMISAVISAANATESDTLGISASAPDSKNLVHLDTEQSPYDHAQLVLKALKRAGIDQDPDWLQSYALAGMTAKQQQQALADALKQAELDGGVYAVIIDGAADLVVDVNDANECNPFVAWLHGLAIKHKCPIVCVIHENPNSATGKMRGHLGSQLERKAESNLRLEKTDGITVLYSDKQRGAPIPKDIGPSFQWSDIAGMHVSVANAGDQRANKKRADLVELATEAFGINNPQLRYSELSAAIVKTRGCAISTAERHIGNMQKLKVIASQGFGVWSLATTIRPSTTIN